MSARMPRCVGISQTEDERAEYKVKHTCLKCKVKKSCHNDKKEWLENKDDEVQQADGKNDMRALYCTVQDITGTRRNASTLIKDRSGNILLDINEQDLC